MSLLAVPADFNHGAKKYRFWCCHVRKFTLTWSLIELVILLGLLITITCFLSRFDETVEPEGEPQGEPEPGNSTTASAEPEPEGEPHNWTASPEPEPEGEEAIFGEETDGIIKTFWALGLLFCAMFFVLALLALHGLSTAQPDLLLYHLVAQVAGLVVSLGVVVLGCVVVFRLAETEATKELWTVTLVCLYAVISMNLYALWVGYKCYVYLCDLRRAIDGTGRRDSMEKQRPLSGLSIVHPEISVQ